MSDRTSLMTDLRPIYDEIADFFAASPTAQQIMAFQLSDDSEAQVSALLEANRTRGLTPDERAALDDYTRVERLMQAIKVKAYAHLQTSSK